MLSKEEIIEIDKQRSNTTTHSPIAIYLLEQLQNRCNDTYHCLELGCWGGGTTLAMTKVAKEVDTKIYAIDTWSGTLHDSEQNRLEQYGSSDIESIFDSQWNKHPELLKHLVKIKGTSKDIPHGVMFNLIFIDASHYYDDVLVDIDNVLPYLNKNGGLLTFDDYGNWGNTRGPRGAVEDRLLSDPRWCRVDNSVHNCFAAFEWRDK